MLLAIDVGTSDTVLGLYGGGHWAGTERFPTQPGRPAEAFDARFDSLLSRVGAARQEPQCIIVASVVRAQDAALRAYCEEWLGRPALFAGQDLHPSMPVRYEPPESLGADRLVDAFAALRLYGAPALVIDVGTATTFEAVSRGGEYIGGAILPGIGISLAALRAAAPHLPNIEIGPPDRLIGCSTVESLRSGVYYGAVAQIEGLARRFRRRLGKGTRVIATGGFAERLAPAVRLIDHVNPLLTLEGLRILWQETSSNRS
jgi:type III pantothenate kinase